LLLDGVWGTLDAAIRGRNGKPALWNAKTNEPVDRQGLFEVAFHLALHLHTMHQAKPALTHGNVRSTNILVTASGGVAFADFGLGRAVAHTHANHAKVDVLETPRWLAPEQLTDEKQPNLNLASMASATTASVTTSEATATNAATTTRPLTAAMAAATTTAATGATVAATTTAAATAAATTTAAAATAAAMTTAAAAAMAAAKTTAAAGATAACCGGRTGRMLDGEKIDVWMYGVVLWEMYTGGRWPYSGLIKDSRVVDAIRSKGSQLLSSLKGEVGLIPSAIVKIIEGTQQTNVSDRWDMGMVCAALMEYGQREKFLETWPTLTAGNMTLPVINANILPRLSQVKRDCGLLLPDRLPNYNPLFQETQPDLKIGTVIDLHHCTYQNTLVACWPDPIEQLFVPTRVAAVKEARDKKIPLAEASALGQLSMAYVHGMYGAPQDSDTGFAHIVMAVSKDPKSELPALRTHLGQCLLFSWGVENRRADGVEILNRAAEVHDDPIAQFYSGLSREWGYGCSANLSLALKYYEQCKNNPATDLLPPKMERAISSLVDRALNRISSATACFQSGGMTGLRTLTDGKAVAGVQFTDTTGLQTLPDGKSGVAVIDRDATLRDIESRLLAAIVRLEDLATVFRHDDAAAKDFNDGLKHHDATKAKWRSAEFDWRQTQTLAEEYKASGAEYQIKYESTLKDAQEKKTKFDTLTKVDGEYENTDDGQRLKRRKSATFRQKNSQLFSWDQFVSQAGTASEIWRTLSKVDRLCVLDIEAFIKRLRDYSIPIRRLLNCRVNASDLEPLKAMQDLLPPTLIKRIQPLITLLTTDGDNKRRIRPDLTADLTTPAAAAAAAAASAPAL
jgi:serine/threonine protein kinase